MNRLLLGCLFCSAMFCDAEAKTKKDNAHVIPVGWRAPNDKELNMKWRNSSPNRFTSLATDFNGDGIGDSARILVKNDGKSFGLFVWLSGNNAPISVIEGEDIESLKAMGIEIAKPEKYKTVCEKVYINCEKWKNEVANLKQSAINYFRSESANSFFIWDAERKIFIREWMSD